MHYALGRTDSKVKPGTLGTDVEGTIIRPYGSSPPCPECSAFGIAPNAVCMHVSLPGYMLEEDHSDYRVDLSGVAIVESLEHLPNGFPYPYFDFGFFHMLVLRQRIYYRDSPVYGERNWSYIGTVTEVIGGTERVKYRDVAKHVERAIKGLGLLRLAADLGRPVGSGTYSDAESLRDAIIPIMQHLFKEGMGVSYESVCHWLHLSDRQLKRLVKDLGLDWQQLKRVAHSGMLSPSE